MADLYRQHGGAPVALPATAYDAGGNAWSDLANSEKAREMTGFVLAPARPNDTAEATAEWDSATAAWVMVVRPTPPAPPPEVFPPISARQFFQALAMAPYGIITAQESLDAVKTGEIPAVMQAVIDALPAQAQYQATMLIAGATEFERSNPLVEVFGGSQDMDAAAIDTFWRFAGRL